MLHNYSLLTKIETNKYKKTDYLIEFIKQITNKQFLANDLNSVILELNNHLKMLEKKVLKKCNPTLSKIFYEISLSKLQSLENYLKEKNLIEFYNKIKLIHREMLKNYYYYIWNKKKYIWLVFYKYFSLYWTSYIYLIISVVVTSILFWLIFFAYDALFYPYVWDWKLRNIRYYCYISISTLSNLWVDTSLAWDWFLKIIFSIEQIWWIAIFGILINIINN